MRWSLLSVFLLAGIAPTGHAKQATVPARRPPIARAENAYPIERRIRYSFSIENRRPALVRAAEVLAFAPVERTSMQHTGTITASQPFELRRDGLGNQKLRFVVTLPPFGSKVISVDAVVAFARAAQPQRLRAPQLFLRPERFTQIDDPAIRETAASLGGVRPTEIAARIESWVADHVREAGYVAQRRGALLALESGRGDCTEHADLFVALTRARGVPARTVAGFIVDHDTLLRAAAYHNWAEAYVEGTWRLADPDKGVWGTSPSQYLAMQILGGDAEEAHGAPVFTSHPDLAVRLE